MSTYQKSGFDSAGYQSLRPVYPAEFYAYLGRYVAGKKAAKSSDGTPQVDLLVDLACGTGIATAKLAFLAKRTVGVDPGPPMIREAKAAAERAAADGTGAPNKPEFVVGSDATLTELFEAGSVDVLTVAEGAHWLKYPEFFSAAATVLKPGGVLAVWAYSTEMHFVEHPQVFGLVTDYSFSDKYGLGGYWDPGTALLRNAYRDVLPPASEFKDIEYRSILGADDVDGEPLVIRRRSTVGQWARQFYTWSAYHNWKADHPETPEDEHPPERFLHDVLAATGLKPESEVTLAWDTAYYFARRRTVDIRIK